MLIRITARHFCAGVIVEDDRVTEWAPVLQYMAWWTPERVEEYCTLKGWTYERLWDFG